MLPASVGDYRIDRLLGKGGMGSVYLAYDTTLRRPVALKVLDSSPDSADHGDQLLREARHAAALNHPNICTIHEVRQAEGSAYIAMEYVDGQTLADRLKQGPMAMADVIRYGVQAADALAYAHGRGVVHRDLKAANVIVSGAGLLKVVDFGLARRTDSESDGETTAASVAPAGAALGTPYAMAPEQARGQRADERSDVWALGVLLYEMAAGRRPFTAPSVVELFSAILRDEPVPLPAETPPALRAVIVRCLEKDPARRYQHAGEVRAALEQVDPRAVTASTLPRARARRWFIVAAAAVLLAAAAAGWTLNVGGLRTRLTPGSRAQPIKLAVLPFKNYTGDPQQEFFSDGLTDEMIGALARLHPDRLSVISRSASMRYKAADKPLDQIARELGVDYIVEGSARREGNRVRISAALVGVSDQIPRWSDTYERELSGILGVQSDVARGVADALSLTLLPDERTRLANVPQVDSEAYEAYLRGRGHASRMTSADLDRALEYFGAALGRNPNYAPAHAGVGNVWIVRQQMGFARPQDAAPQIKASLNKALAVDDSLPDAHLGLANTLTWTDWNWEAGEREFRRTLQLAPNLAPARAFYAHFLLILNRPPEAEAQMLRAMTLDPADDLVQALYGRYLVYMRRYDEALVFAERVLSTTPKSPMGLNIRRDALYHLGRSDEAFAAERQVWTARGDREVDEALTRGYAEGGYTAALSRAADILARRARETDTAPQAVTNLYRRSGRIAESFEWAERAIQLRDPNVPYIGLGPSWDASRNDPRYHAIRRRLNLPS